MSYRYGEDLVKLVWILVLVVAVLVPLALWKIVDIIAWIGSP